MSQMLNDMNEKFYKLQRDLKLQLDRKLPLAEESWGGTAMHTPEGLVSGSPLGELAQLNIYMGSSVPEDDLGDEGDMYALVNPARADKLPGRANWREFASNGETLVLIADKLAFCAVTKDAKTWTVAAMPVEARWSGITYGNGRFVAISFDGETAYSTNGIDWELGATLDESKRWGHVTFGAGRFVAVAFGGDDGGAEFTQVSTDGGATWSLATLPYALLWTDITYGGGKFLALSAHRALIAYSNDGSSWTGAELPVAAVWTSVAYGGGKFVAVAQNSSYVAYSLDGINWTLGSMPFHGNWNAIHYAEGMWLATCDRNDSVAISLDGFVWHEHNSPVNARWGCIGSLHGDFVYAAHDSDFIIAQSAADMKSLLTVNGSFGVDTGGSTTPRPPQYDDIDQAPVTGGLCMTPSSDLTSLAMWFQPVDEPYESDKPVLRWTKGSNSQGIGTLINPPRGAKSVTIAKHAHWYSVSIKMDVAELATLDTDLGYTVSILRDDCMDNNYVEGVHSTDIDLTTGIISFTSLNSSQLMDSSRKYCLVVYR